MCKFGSAAPIFASLSEIITVAVRHIILADFWFVDDSQLRNKMQNQKSRMTISISTDFRANSEKKQNFAIIRIILSHFESH